jgi:hypothetical protein
LEDDNRMEASAVDVTVKSVETPVVAPVDPDTTIVQEIVSPARMGLEAVQASVEKRLGTPNTGMT